MATQIIELTHPAQASALGTGEGHRSFGVFAALVGWALVGVGFLVSLSSASLAAAGGKADQLAAQQALGFGIAVAGLGTAKTGIAFVLWGIVRRIWVRLDSVRTALPDLKAPAPATSTSYGLVDTRQGKARVSQQARSPIFIHQMARYLFLPMLLMGVMALYIGLIVSFAESSSYGSSTAGLSLKAWVQGLQFLGEGLVLSAISFLLGSILGAIRDGGGHTQQSIGVPVKTLVMPYTAWIFIVLMATGMMVSIAQFVVYAYVATQVSDPQTVRTYLTWLGPLREFGVGILLTGITFALVTIARALRFQFDRVVEIITTGR